METETDYNDGDQLESDLLSFDDTTNPVEKGSNARLISSKLLQEKLKSSGSAYVKSAIQKKAAQSGTQALAKGKLGLAVEGAKRLSQLKKEREKLSGGELEESIPRIDEARVARTGPQNLQEAIAVVNQVYRDEKLVVNPDLVTELTVQGIIQTKKPKMPPFPAIIFTIAIIKDIVDGLVTATIVGIVVSEIFSVLFAFVLFVWVFYKGQATNRGLYRKYLLGWISSVIVELIPGVQVVPAEGMFVFWVYYMERRAVAKERKVLKKLKKLRLAE